MLVSLESSVLPLVLWPPSMELVRDLCILLSPFPFSGFSAAPCHPHPLSWIVLISRQQICWNVSHIKKKKTPLTPKSLNFSLVYLTVF